RDFHVTGVQTCALPILFAKYILKKIKTHSLNLKNTCQSPKTRHPPLRSGAKIEQIPTPRNSSTQIKSHNPDILTNKNQMKGNDYCLSLSFCCFSIVFSSSFKSSSNSIRTDGV